MKMKIVSKSAATIEKLTKQLLSEGHTVVSNWTLVEIDGMPHKILRPDVLKKLQNS